MIDKPQKSKQCKKWGNGGKCWKDGGRKKSRNQWIEKPQKDNSMQQWRCYKGKLSGKVVVGD